MTAVERVKQICKQRGIAISKLEKDLGYANAYINQCKKGTIPSDRLRSIAAYLGVDSRYINGEIDEVFYPDEISSKMCEDVAAVVLDPGMSQYISFVPYDVRKEIASGGYRFSNITFPQFGKLIGKTAEDYLGIKKEPSAPKSEELGEYEREFLEVARRLSPENQAKLLELAKLYLMDQEAKR